MEYTPYGESWIEKSDDLFDMLPYKFTAKELDDETGLYYYGARYLNPRTSRWISSDPAGFELINPTQKGFSMSGINWYAYASNNPVMFKDPTGLDDLHVNYDRIEKEVSFTFVPRTQSGGIDEKNIQQGSFKAANKVRNEQNGKRPSPNVPTMPTGENYYPRNFPEGKSNIKGYKEKKYGPTIFTDAKQVVPVYNENGEQKGMALDIGYNLHGGDSDGNITGNNNVDSTTLGCVRGDNAGIRSLFPMIDKAKETGGSATLSAPERTLKYNGQNVLSGM
ncbi:MAG: hypothetical protein DRP58_06025 [Spirochaetes bacterium]|nr:MAG: hypothetical protein DRP58_06025 [Spirochaetota bacterium]